MTIDKELRYGCECHLVEHEMRRVEEAREKLKKWKERLDASRSKLNRLQNLLA